MIRGHEEITHDLNEQEYELALRIAPILKGKTKENPVLAIQIINGVNEKWNPKPKFTDARLRKIINYYRVQSILPVISTSKGYYVSYEEDEINGMIQSLTQRANSIIDASFGLGRILKKVEPN
jgi:hypothetical protein